MLLLQVERKEGLGLKEYQVEFHHIHDGTEWGRKRLGKSNLRGITVAVVSSEGKTAIGVVLCARSEPSFVREKGRAKALAEAIRKGPFKEDAAKIFLAYHARPREAAPPARTTSSGEQSGNAGA